MPRQRSTSGRFASIQRVEARVGVRRLAAGCAAQHVGGELGVEAEEIVAQRGAGHRLPAVLARQRRDPVAQPVQVQPAADEEVQRRDIVDRALGGAGHADDVERGEEVAEARDAAGELGGHAVLDELARTRASNASRSAAHEHAGQRVGDRGGPGGEALDLGADVERARPAAQQPARGALDEPAGLEQHRDLRARVDLEVERLDVGPEAAHVEDVARDGVGARDVCGARAGVLLQAEHERDAGAVDDAVRDPRGDDLAPQPVRARSRSAKRSGSGAGK